MTQEERHKKLCEHAEAVRKDLNAAGILIVGFFVDGQHLNIQDGCTWLPMPTAAVYAQMHELAEANARARQGYQPEADKRLS